MARPRRRGSTAPLRGTLAIPAPMSFGTLHLGPILARFAEAHPRLDLRIEFDDRDREGFDIAYGSATCATPI